MAGTPETMISLQWVNFQAHIVKGLASMFSTVEEFADVTLVCGDGCSFKAHKVILSMWSPYFRDIFLNNSCNHPVIILRDTKSEDIQVILQFIYEGQALLRPENEMRILETAVSLQISGFSQMKEPIQPGASSTPIGAGTSYQNLRDSGSRSTVGRTQVINKTPPKRQTIISVSPIQSTMDESRATISIETPPAPKVLSTSTTPVYKPHKRKIELTPTKITVTSPPKNSKSTDDKDEGSLTTMYSMDQQRIIVTEQEIPRCSTSGQELEFIEIINISPEQNSITLNMPTELDTAPPLEPVETEASYIFRSPSPTYSAQTQVASSGTPTNHRTIKEEHAAGNGRERKSNMKGSRIEEMELVPCPKCGKNVKETSLRVHMSRTHLEEGTILVCPICSKVIHSRGVYYKHMYIHRKKGQKIVERRTVSS